MNELYAMFKQHKIDISVDDLKVLFSIIDKTGSGELSLEQFKQFATSPEANTRKKFANV